MAMREGWISIYREIQDHWIWQDAQKLKQWIDILLTANSEDTTVNIGLELYECKRGQSLISIQGWASRWNISKSAARSFLSLLEKQNMIKMESIQKSTRLTVCEYEDYQGPTHEKKPVKKVKKEVDLSFVDQQYMASWAAWLQHKKERRENYASERSMKIGYDQMIKKCNNNPEIAMLMVIQTISNNWAGLFAYKGQLPPVGKANELINQNAKLKQMFSFENHSKAS